MTRVYVWLIRAATPRSEREWVVGDTLEEFAHIEGAAGRRVAARWLRREAWRVIVRAPEHRLALGRRVRPLAPERGGDSFVGTLRDDIRYCLRLLKRSPGFAAVAIATLALGIGANTAMFAVVNGVLLKPLPFLDPDRLMLMHLLAPDRQGGPGAFREVSWSYPKYRTFLSVQTVFTESAVFGGREMSLTDLTDPERLRGEVVSERYLAVLGVTPVLGRPFTGDEAHVAGTGPVAMIGESIWRRRFGSDPATIGRTIHIDRNPYTVVAVLPRAFRGLSGQADIWVPVAAYMPQSLTQDQNHSLTLVARRRDDTSEAQAAMSAGRIGQRVEEEFKTGQFDGRPWSAKAVSLTGSRAELDLRRATFVLLGAVSFVLLIACVNLATLVSAKFARRTREVAIRIALGATRGRIARQFIVETLVLTSAGAIAGVVCASLMLSASSTLLPDSDTFFRAREGARPPMRGSAGLTQIGASMIGLDTATLLFACAVALLCALLVASLPTIQASLLRPIEALRASAATTMNRRRFDTRSVMVVSQVALALVLLAGAGLMLKSLFRLQSTSVGIDATGLMTARIQLPNATYNADVSRAFYVSLLERVRALPGVEAAALGSCPPVSGMCNSTLIRFERGLGRFTGNEPVMGVYWATPTYFSTLGIRVMRGRTFTDQDRAGTPKVAVINDTAARKLFAGSDPLGKFIAIGQGGFDDGAEIIGVVSDVRYVSVESAPVPDVYIPVLQSSQTRMELYIRSAVAPGALVPALRNEVRALDPNLPLANVRLMDERLGDAMWQTRMSAWLLSAFSALAVLLTGIGVFGVVAQTVAQRTNEFGIRLAIGAEARDVLGLVMRRAVTITGAGLVTGLAAAFALSRLVSALLYGVPSYDPATYLIVAIGLTAVIAVAAYIPARRATRIQAIVALRSE